MIAAAFMVGTAAAAHAAQSDSYHWEASEENPQDWTIVFGPVGEKVANIKIACVSGMVLIDTSDAHIVGPFSTLALHFISDPVGTLVHQAIDRANIDLPSLPNPMDFFQGNSPAAVLGTPEPIQQSMRCPNDGPITPASGAIPEVIPTQDMGGMGYWYDAQRKIYHFRASYGSYVQSGNGWLPEQPGTPAAPVPSAPAAPLAPAAAPMPSSAPASVGMPTSLLPATSVPLPATVAAPYVPAQRSAQPPQAFRLD